MSALAAVVLAIVGGLLVGWGLATPGDQIALVAIGGALIGAPLGWTLVGAAMGEAR